MTVGGVGVGVGAFADPPMPPHPASKAIRTKAKPTSERVEMQWRRRIGSPSEVLSVPVSFDLGV